MKSHQWQSSNEERDFIRLYIKVRDCNQKNELANKIFQLTGYKLPRFRNEPITEDERETLLFQVKKYIKQYYELTKQIEGDRLLKLQCYPIMSITEANKYDYVDLTSGEIISSKEYENRYLSQRKKIKLEGFCV